MYIHSLCSISALPMIQLGSPLPDLNILAPLTLIEPKYADYIPAMQLRRMSKCLKMGLVAALDCQKQSEVPVSDIKAIEVGTAYGLHVDSAVFLTNMIERNETALNPTSFIQSTHNTISGAIALSLQSNVHNMTFVHKGFSFENALLDTSLILGQSDSEAMVLVGGVDEKIEVLNRLFKGQVRKLPFGESATFFMIGNKVEGAMARLKATHTFETKNMDIASEQIKQVMAQYDCSKGLCPTVIWNSNNAAAMVYAPNIHDVSKIVGYNPTGAALAMAIGLKYLQNDAAPVVVINQFEQYWSVFTLEQP